MNRPERAGRSALARTLVSTFLEAIGDGPEQDAAQTFIDKAAADAAPDEPSELTPAELAENLADFWRFAEKRNGPGPAVRLVPCIGDGAGALSRLEVIQDDAPFLVDSVMGEFAEQGVSVRAMYHPVVSLVRDAGGRRGGEGRPKPESMIQVIFDAVAPHREAALLEGVRATLADVHAAVQDFQAMAGLMGSAIAELKQNQGPVRNIEEEITFLTWLQNEHFVFLGARTYEYPRLKSGEYAPEEPLYRAKDGLGVLRDPERMVLRRANEPAVLTKHAKDRILKEPPVTVAKSNQRSRVHRRAYMDYIGIKRFGEDGLPSGEVRFVGLFTAEAYDQPANAVPLLRAKLASVLQRASLTPGSHNEKRLRNILENHPRDELFQTSEAELLPLALDILHLYDRPRIRLFERRDPFDRFASILFYLPRERYDSDLQDLVGKLLAGAFNGRVSASYPSFSDAPLARVHYIIGFTPGDHLRPDLATVEAEVVEAARTWEDRLEAAVRASGMSPDEMAAVLARYEGAFPAGYRDLYDADEALKDIAKMHAFAPGDAIRVRAFRWPSDPPTRFRFKLYNCGAPAPLADILPILDNMGLKALAERGAPVRRAESEVVWVHEFEIEDVTGESLALDEVREAFEEAFIAIWGGKAENDGFNRLVLELSISWREAALVRALARHRQQSGLDPSQRVQEKALSDHPGIARLILDMFRTKFDPAIAADVATRRHQAEAVMGEIVEALQQVESLDDDRVLRRLAQLVLATKRTNFYQSGADGEAKAYISFKAASSEIADLPAPKPYREIFVSAVGVEGAHLRFGPVARGGLRWSDRRDDFRTEVLGLVKAQQVKNAVIVPVGSKGGFYPKALPKGDPAAIRAEAVRAYTTFLQGLLDLTDNLDPKGRVVRPEAVIAHDDDDPYLVVAADKGTATFSDIANGVAESYDFWLGDAFASGGSAGYDHKVMGITARGAWEAVKRHFREMGKDIQAEPFTVIGVGDMSGDVFGNGMLLSKQIRLLAAFDHRHIFFDPDPDPATSWEERERMFALPRSSWDDYDRTKISAGGGVFARSLKSIPLTPQIRALLQIEDEALAPTELIKAVLKAPAELLYLGGIGTYVKAKTETHGDVGDKTNDALRINGSDLKVQVVAEGANLGLTQRGRIEFAQGGGRIDTDAIDNSAGVDCSDHEVNIKIVTGMLERAGELTRAKRNTLLKSMTDEVAEHVLAHNYAQTLALSLLEMDSVGELEPHARFMAQLEALGRLDRTVEALPDPLEISERAAAGRGLTRPELAVLLAYGKLELSHAVAASHAAEDSHFAKLLEAYFPKALRKRREAIQRHRLRREIIATVVANDIVNRCGPSFPSRLMAAADCDAGALAIAFEAVKATLDIDRLWDLTEALDGQIPAAGQMALFRRLSTVLRGATFWFARRAAQERLSVGDLVKRYGQGLKTLKDLSPEILSAESRGAIETRTAALVEEGAPADLARETSILLALTTAADLVDLAAASSWPLANVARLYHRAGEAFGFDRLRNAAGRYTAGDHFERQAVRRLIEDLLAVQTEVTRALMAFSASPEAGETGATAEAATSSWAALRRDVVATARRTLEEIEASPGPWTFAKLTIATAALRQLAAETGSRRKRAR
jgi:glutamate dehydrogenase